MYVPLWRKITGRIYGAQMCDVLKAAFLLIKHCDKTAFDCFCCALRIYILGAHSNNGLMDRLGILSSKLDENGHVSVGKFRFVYDKNFIISLRRDVTTRWESISCRVILMNIIGILTGRGLMKLKKYVFIQMT